MRASVRCYSAAVSRSSVTGPARGAPSRRNLSLGGIDSPELRAPLYWRHHSGGIALSRCNLFPRRKVDAAKINVQQLAVTIPHVTPALPTPHRRRLLLLLLLLPATRSVPRGVKRKTSPPEQPHQMRFSYGAACDIASSPSLLRVAARDTLRLRIKAAVWEARRGQAGIGKLAIREPAFQFSQY